MGPEIYPEVLKGLLGRRGLAVAQCGSKNTDSSSAARLYLALVTPWTAHARRPCPLTAEAPGKYYYYYYSFLFVSFCSVVFIIYYLYFKCIFKYILKIVFVRLFYVFFDFFFLVHFLFLFLLV